MIDGTEQKHSPSSKSKDEIKEGFSAIFLRFRKESTIRKVRMVVMYGITVLAYVLAVFQLFFQEQLLHSMVPLLIFFIFFHFAFLEIRHRGMKRLWSIFGITTVVELIALGFHSWQVPIAMIIFNLAIVSLASALSAASSGKRKFSAGVYFTAGAYIFSMCMTVAYSLFLIGGKGNFDLNCTNIQENSNSFVDIMMTPVNFGKQQIQILGSGAIQIKESMKDFFSSDAKDVVALTKNVEIIPVEEETLGDKLLGKFTDLKNKISAAVDENSKVSLGICDLILNKIEKLYENPGFQFAIVLLMWLLLYPFVRIAFWLVTAVAYLLFQLLYALNVYKKHKIVEEVEEII